MKNEKLSIVEGMDVYRPDVDGVINCMHNYCLNLYDKSNLTVVVPKNRKDYVDNFPYEVTRCKSIRLPILNNYYGFPNRDKKFKNKIEQNKYDIVHFHSPFNMAGFCAKIAKKQDIPLVSTYHSNMKHIFKDVVKFNFIANIGCKILAKTYNKCDEVFVCSPLVEQQARECGYTGKISYLPFGTEIPKCDTVEENRQKANKEFNLTNDELVFIYIGRVMKLKRIDFILDSLKIVKDTGKKFKFFIVGKGAYLKKLQKYAKKLGFNDDEVIFTGFLPREQFPLLLSRSDLLLFPSIYDNFGLVKVECAAFDTAGLFIKDSCAGYDVKHNHNGYLSKDTVEDYAKQIIEITKDREKLKQAGINAGKELYIHWSTCTELLHKRLNEICNEYKQKKGE